MQTLGARCHELRIPDGKTDWRLLYRIDRDAIVIVGVFSKKTQKTPKKQLESARGRLKRYDQATEGMK